VVLPETWHNVGWLLRCNRALGQDKALRSGREFARAFRRDGRPPLAPSQVTRWESGVLAASRSTIRRYEHLLGLAPESLVTIGDALARSDGLRLPETADDTTPSDKDTLHELLERASTPQAMTGNAWSRLTELVASRPTLVLHPPRLWREIADNLLAELSVSAYVEWLQRQEAMSRLLEHRDACRHAVAACIALAADPSSPVVIEPLSLLDVTSHAEANGYVLAQLRDPASERALYGALLAALRKVAQRHFHDDQWPQLGRAVRGYLEDSTVDQTVLPLALEVLRRLARQTPGEGAVVRAMRNARGARGERPAPSETRDPRLLTTLVAAALGPHSEDLSPDRPAAKLIDEMLFHPDSYRRTLASMLMSATPYRAGLARAMLAELSSGLGRRGHTPPAAILRTLTDLGADIHRPLIHRLLTRADVGAEMVHAAAWATPHCAGRDPEPLWRKTLAARFGAWKADRSALNASVVHAIAYGIGTDGHSRLLREIRDDEEMPSQARSVASWLLATPAGART
jgi:hypothetical protein